MTASLWTASFAVAIASAGWGGCAGTEEAPAPSPSPPPRDEPTAEAPGRLPRAPFEDPEYVDIDALAGQARQLRNQREMERDSSLLAAIALVRPRNGALPRAVAALDDVAGGVRLTADVEGRPDRAFELFVRLDAAACDALAGKAPAADVRLAGPGAQEAPPPGPWRIGALRLDNRGLARFTAVLPWDKIGGGTLRDLAARPLLLVADGNVAACGSIAIERGGPRASED
jgi:hypothetical protein